MSPESGRLASGSLSREKYDRTRFAAGKATLCPRPPYHGPSFMRNLTILALLLAAFSALPQSVQELVVTNVEDSGRGSLRQALLDVPQCRGCDVVFRIGPPVPAEGWFTIRPLSPLPPVAADVIEIDGSAQTLHTGDTNPAGPEILLDGAALLHGHGLQLTAGSVRVTGIAAGHFPGNGVAILATNYTWLERCHLGMDPSGVRPMPNGTRGVQIEGGGGMEVFDNLFGGNFRSGGWFEGGGWVSIARNRFTNNGASGFYAKMRPTYTNVVRAEGNIISGNAHAGISLDRMSVGSFAANQFHGNLGRAIDIGIDGPTLQTHPGIPGLGGFPGAPVVTSARFENGETVVHVRIPPKSRTYMFGDRVHFYTNTVPKDGGDLLEVVGASFAHDKATLRIARDLRGQWVSAAIESGYILNLDDAQPATSEISEPVLVQ
jgi:hypothetical protein